MTPSPLRLDRVCKIIMGQAPSGDTYNTERKGWPLIAGAGDFGDRFPASKKFTTAATKLCQHGDIILGVRATIGEKVLADGVYCLGRGVAGLRPSSGLNSRYLWHWLSHIRPQLQSKAKGATFKQVSKEDIGELQLSLPSMEKQQRIADVLDRAEALRFKRIIALSQLDALSHSLFYEFFGHVATTATKWPLHQLQQVVRRGTIVTYGIVQAGEEFPGGVPYIRTGDIADGEIMITGLRHTTPQIAARFGRSRVEAGDIVMSIRATVGTTALVPLELSGANLTQGTARIAPGEDVDRAYLLACLRAPGTQQWIKQQIKGATFQEITLSRLRELPVAIPPLPIQQKFASCVAVVEKLKLAQKASLVQLEELFVSLQQRAFRGEL